MTANTIASGPATPGSHPRLASLPQTRARPDKPITMAKAPIGVASKNGLPEGLWGVADGEFGVDMGQMSGIGIRESKTTVDGTLAVYP